LQEIKKQGERHGEGERGGRERERERAWRGEREGEKRDENGRMDSSSYFKAPFSKESRSISKSATNGGATVSRGALARCVLRKSEERERRGSVLTSPELYLFSSPRFHLQLSHLLLLQSL
jgi:hypothetical protein